MAIGKLTVGVTDDDLDGDPLAPAPLGRSAKMDDAPLRSPTRRRLTDEEILAKYGDRDSEKYSVPPNMVPPGMAYEWKTQEVIGRVNSRGMNEYQRMGWQFVPAKRHQGFWTDAKGDEPIALDGMVLMEIDEETFREMRRHDKLEAKERIKTLVGTINGAPPGTGPRDQHAKTKASIKRTYEPLMVE